MREKRCINWRVKRERENVDGMYVSHVFFFVCLGVLRCTDTIQEHSKRSLRKGPWAYFNWVVTIYFFPISFLWHEAKGTAINNEGKRIEYCRGGICLDPHAASVSLVDVASKMCGAIGLRREDRYATITWLGSGVSRRKRDTKVYGNLTCLSRCIRGNATDGYK